MKATATKLTTADFQAAWIRPDLIDSIGRGGEIRTPDPLRPSRIPAFAANALFSMLSVSMRCERLVERC